MTKREMTCIICPMGCSLTVELEGEEVKSISGNTCKRGAAYAQAEVTRPQRTVTSTMRCDNGDVLSVKTDIKGHGLHSPDKRPYGKAPGGYRGGAAAGRIRQQHHRHGE